MRRRRWERLRDDVSAEDSEPDAVAHSASARSRRANTSVSSAAGSSPTGLSTRAASSSGVCAGRLICSQLHTVAYTMPVRREDHDEEIDLTPGTRKSEIVCLLYQNRGLGYRPVEIQEELDLPRGTTATTLTRLVDDGYVGKTADSVYYALQERDDLARYAAAREQTERLFETQEREPDG